MNRCDAEDFILGMTDIIMENRALRYELAEAKRQIKKYEDRELEREKQLNEGMKTLFEAGMAGVFATPEERRNRENRA